MPSISCWQVLLFSRPLLPGRPQPTQKRFDSALLETMRGFDPRRPVWLEAESKKIGEIRVPQNLIDTMWASQCVRLEASVPNRVALLRDEYAHFIADPGALREKLGHLKALRGTEATSRWHALIGWARTPACPYPGR